MPTCQPGIITHATTLVQNKLRKSDFTQ